MKFWKKFWFIMVLALIFLGLCLSAPEIGRLEFSLAGDTASIGIYALIALGLLFWLACFIVKSFFVWFVSLFVRSKSASEIKSSNDLAKLVLAKNADFEEMFDNSYVTETMNVIKVALAIKRGLLENRTFDKTGLHCIDIHIVKMELRKLLQSGDANASINLANKVIKNYANDLRIVQDELLEVAKLAKKGELHFSFNPKKFKYNLSQSFINRYLSELEIVEFYQATTQEKKLNIIERTVKNYPGNFDALELFLDLAFQMKIEEKRILNLVRETISRSPDRRIAYYLLRLQRKDLFELVQSYMIDVRDLNLEKLWMLLIIATERGFHFLIKELLEKIAAIDQSTDLLKFYVENQAKLQKDEIREVITKGIK